MSDLMFLGESFKRNEDLSEFTVMEFAEALAGGVEDGTIQALAVNMAMFKESIHPDDRDRAVRLARSKRATTADLYTVIAEVIFKKADRPTGQSSDSSDGLPAIEPKSEQNSDDKVTEAFPGRPDKQAAILRALRSA